MNWFQKISAQIIPISFGDNDDYQGENDIYQDADTADQIFKERGIRYDSTKNLSHLAIEDGKVIGAVASGWSQNDNYGEDVAVFSFDIVVKKEFQGSLTGIKLIEEAIQQYEFDKEAYDKTMMRLYVVNPKLIPILERRFKFDIEGINKNENNEIVSAHMVRY